MVYSDIKFINLYYIIRELIYSNNSQNDILVKYNPKYGIQIISKDDNFINKIIQLPYFIDNNFYIDITYSKLPNIFYICINYNYVDIEYLTKVYDDFIYIYKTYNVNISMISEKGFIIENLNDQTLIEKIINEFKDRYSINNIKNNYIFLKHNFNLLST